MSRSQLFHCPYRLRRWGDALAGGVVEVEIAIRETGGVSLALSDSPPRVKPIVRHGTPVIGEAMNEYCSLR
ncbi:hypothetical protein [Adonisia turfae]|uniref:hypothetical protein n=1 Tax=Adonisia turfae TaxID=2950184 RepID=UPI0013D0B981|nr:hypothetical protein [Adonisia turfae]